MAELKDSTFPPGMTYTMGYDVSRFLNASISSVLVTLVEAFILVFLVVFIFLQDFRATIIPILAVPVCLIGSLFFMQMMGFSINLLTLFALVLAIGIVVDNGIVVVEAVYAKMEEEHLSPMEATLAAMDEVGSAVIAITLVMSAVFVPVAFLSGPVGIFYRQFSLTLAAAIVISGINALTLTPALCAIILRSPHDKKPGNGLLDRFFRGFNKVYDRISGGYKGLLSKIAGRRIITLLGLVIMFIATWGSAAILPSGFIPTEDQGMIYVAVTTPPGATVDRTEAVLNEVDAISRELDMVETVSILAGYSIVTEVSGASYGMGMINLKQWDDRKESVDDVMKILRERTAHIADAEIEFFPPPTVPGFGNSSGFELRLLDRSGNEDLAQTNEVVNEFISKLTEDEVIESASTTFDVNFPQYMLKIDYDLAAKKGISVENSMNTLQTLLGSLYATNFIRYGQMYKVMVQSDAFARQRPEDVLNLYVKTEEGEMVPYSSFMTMERVYGPEQITRYNMFTSAMITGQAAPGFSSGQAIEAVERISAELPQGYAIEWSGMTREQKISGNQAAYIFLLCLVFVYLLLAAQYESFLLPMPVLLCLPAGLFGAFLFLKVFGLENNIYAQVSLVMLIGLLGKNAILIVEYANLKRKQGMDVLTASIEGAVARLRPILMTSFAFAAGLIPLMLASGAGAIGNRTIGSAAVGGMVIGTIIGVIVIPGLVVLFSKREKKKKIKQASKVAVVSVILLFLVASCSVPKTAAQKEISPELGSQTGQVLKDTISIATLPWKEVFTDSQLISLIDSAMLYNMDVRKAIHRIEMAQANFRFRKSALYPSLDAAVEGGLRKYGHYTESGIGNYDSNFSENLTDDEKLPEPFVPDYFVGVRSSWELDLWGKLRNRREAAFLQLMSESELKRLIETELISSIASAYYELISLDEKVKVYGENIKLHERALEIIEAQKEAGRADELAVQQFKSLLSESKANRAHAEQEILAYEHQINTLLGRVYQPIARSSNVIGSEMLFQDLSVGNLDDLLNNRLDIRKAGMDMKADYHELESSRLAFLPTVAISPHLGLQSFSLVKLFSLDKSVTYGLFGGITMPIFRQRELKSEYERMKASYGISFLEYEKTVLNAVNEVSLALTTQDAIENRSVHVKDQVVALESSIGAAEELFIAGRVTYLDIITAQKGLIEAQVTDVEINKEKMLNQVVLYKALGGGWQ
jgi:HAE1 family hydrophobic/amphiphilic exporter-1